MYSTLKTTNKSSINDEKLATSSKSIKQNFASEEDIKAFLNSGGIITEVPFGQRCSTPLNDYTRLSISDRANTKSTKKIESTKLKSRAPTPKDVATAILKSRTIQSTTTKSTTLASPRPCSRI